MVVTPNSWETGRSRLSFDHLICANQHRLRDLDAQRLGRFHIYDQLKFGWLLDGEVSGICALEYLVDVVCGTSMIFGWNRAETYQAAGDCGKF